MVKKPLKLESFDKIMNILNSLTDRSMGFSCFILYSRHMYLLFGRGWLEALREDEMNDVIEVCQHPVGMRHIVRALRAVGTLAHIEPLEENLRLAHQLNAILAQVIAQDQPKFAELISPNDVPDKNVN